MIVLENVCGAITSHGGKDFAAIGAALAGEGYRFGAMVMDAGLFVPQSRPRLFIVAVLRFPARSGRPGRRGPGRNVALGGALMVAHGKLSKTVTGRVDVVAPAGAAARNTTFADLIEDEAERGGLAHAGGNAQACWHDEPDQPRRRSKPRRDQAGGWSAASTSGRGSTTPATRFSARKYALTTWPAACGRRPAGPAVRAIMIVEGNKVRSRLLSPREAARLMGLPDDYRLPENYNEAYHLAGDGVAVPVVRFLAAHILESILASAAFAEQKAA